MKTQAQLIEYYENNLSKVIDANSSKTTCSTIIERQQAYIAYAKKQLEAVKCGGMEALIKLFDANK